MFLKEECFWLFFGEELGLLLVLGLSFGVVDLHSFTTLTGAEKEKWPEIVAGATQASAVSLGH